MLDADADADAPVVWALVIAFVMRDTVTVLFVLLDRAAIPVLFDVATPVVMLVLLDDTTTPAPAEL